MTNTTPAFPSSLIHHRSFILRVSWDTTSACWCLQLQPVNGEASRLFCDSESLLLYLETIRQAAELGSKA